MNLRKRGIFHSIDEFLLETNTKPLGRGTFGTVRLATHRITLKKYAIKIVHTTQPQIQINEEFGEFESQLLTREVEIHLSLNHPHIVQLWDVLESQHNIYLIMDFIPSGSLFHFQRKRTLTQPQVYRVYSQVIDGLRHLHSHDTFHRDLKPQNILIDHNLNAYLCDFGWAAPQLTLKRKTFCGTHQYMSPQMIAHKEYDYRIDIWAMGILLFELSHGSAPFTASTIEEMQTKINKGSYHINDQLTDPLKTLIIRILQFDPDDRPSLSDIINDPWMCSMREATLRQQKNSSADVQASLSSSVKRNKFMSMRKRKKSRNDSNFKNKLIANTSRAQEKVEKKKIKINDIEDRLLKRKSGGDKENKYKKSEIQSGKKDDPYGSMRKLNKARK